MQKESKKNEESAEIQKPKSARDWLWGYADNGHDGEYEVVEEDGKDDDSNLVKIIEQNDLFPVNTEFHIDNDKMYVQFPMPHFGLHWGNYGGHFGNSVFYTPSYH